MPVDRSKLVDCFERFDVHANGTIDASALKAILSRRCGSAGSTFSEADVAALICRFDHNGDGVLQLDEFIDAMTEVVESSVTVQSEDQSSRVGIDAATVALRQNWLSRVSKYGLGLRGAPSEAKNDLEVVLAAVRQNGHALQHASEAMQNHRDVVIAAVRQDGYAIEHASPELRADRDIALVAVQQYGLAIEYLSAGLRADRDLVMIAVKQDCVALVHASQELRTDAELLALRQRAHVHEEV